MRAVVLVAILAGPAAAAPSLASEAVVVLDAITGAELFATNADEVRSIASLTKLFAALVLRRHHLALDAWTAITRADAIAARGGSPPRLPTGEQFKNVDLLHAMLLVSENRVPTALARSVGLTEAQLIAEMNELANELGLANTRFVDATGILPNRSTARELAIALEAALRDPLLARVMRTRRATFSSRSGAATLDFTSTVRPLWERYHVHGGKTGHSEDAGYCLVASAEIGKRRVVMAFLGGARSRDRYDDYVHVANWVARGRRD